MIETKHFIDWVSLYVPNHSEHIALLPKAIRYGNVKFEWEKDRLYLADFNTKIRAWKNNYGLSIQIPSTAFGESYLNNFPYELDHIPILERFPRETIVSRIDVARDFESFNLEFETRKNIKKSAHYEQSGKKTGQSYGGRGKEYIYLRVYDKEQQDYISRRSCEVRHGYTDLHRIEFEIGRQWLVNFGILNIEDFLATTPEKLFKSCLSQKRAILNGINPQSLDLTKTNNFVRLDLWRQALGCFIASIGSLYGTQTEIRCLEYLKALKAQISLISCNSEAIGNEKTLDQANEILLELKKPFKEF